MAASGSNHAALEWFGLKWIHKNNWRGTLGKIREAGLPVFTSPGPEQLSQNDHVVSSLFGKEDGCSHRRLALAFDKTYLVKCSQLATTELGHVLLGGCHRPAEFQLPDEAQHVIKARDGTLSSIVIKKRRVLATEVECCIVWDPTRAKGPTMDVASFPCVPAACQDPRFESVATSNRNRGSWETLMRIGCVLKESPSVKHILADAHGSHQLLGNWLQGLDVPLSDDLKRLVPFFNTLRFEDLPICCFPIPARVALQGQEAVHFWAGPAHSQKSFVEQQRSPLRTIHFGNRFCDSTASLELGLFVCSYVGTDGQSDKQAALWFLEQSWFQRIILGSG